jgi:hypothetical protein
MHAPLVVPRRTTIGRDPPPGHPPFQLVLGADQPPGPRLAPHVTTGWPECHEHRTRLRPFLSRTVSAARDYRATHNLTSGVARCPLRMRSVFASPVVSVRCGGPRLVLEPTLGGGAGVPQNRRTRRICRTSVTSSILLDVAHAIIPHDASRLFLIPATCEHGASGDRRFLARSPASSERGAWVGSWGGFLVLWCPSGYRVVHSCPRSNGDRGSGRRRGRLRGESRRFDSPRLQF